jgi:hypothetical protein
MSDPTTDDLVEKLRASASHARFDRPLWAGSKLMEQAADEIDRLRAERTYEARKATIEHCSDPWECCIHDPDMRGS